MNTSSLPQELRESLSRTDQFISSATLIHPCLTEGTVVFDHAGEKPGVRGDFFPWSTKISISENERCQLLLAKSSVVLNVIMSPGPSERSEVLYYRFELVAWEPLAKSISNLANPPPPAGGEAG